MKIRITIVPILLFVIQIGLVYAQIDYGHPSATPQLTPTEQLQFQQTVIEKKVGQIQEQQSLLEEKINQTQLRINIIIGFLVSMAISIVLIYIKQRSKSKTKNI